MLKLIRGILDFRKNVLPTRKELFHRLSAGQSPDVLFITCSDSRVAPNWFASTDPGDLFVIRNVGNLVPPVTAKERDTSVPAALEFSLATLNISDIVICGHSGCGAIRALSAGLEKLPATDLRNWLKVGEPSVKKNREDIELAKELSEEDGLSQKNVLQQMEHLKTYPEVKERLARKTLRVHGWWFNIAEGGVHIFDEPSRRFLLIDEKVGTRLLASLATKER